MFDGISNKEDIKKIIDEEYASLPLEERQELYKLFFDENTRANIKNQLKHIIFKQTPPTPEEFLSLEGGWLSKEIIETIFPVVREEFIESMNQEKNYFQIVSYGASRTGKTFRVCLQIVYTIIFIHHLREPQLFYNLSPASKFSIYLLSFNYKKTKELYLDTIYMLLEKSPSFQRLERQDDVYKRQEESGMFPIYWSKASNAGKMTLASGLQLQLGNKDYMSVIGANIIQAYISEINFFIETEGITEEEILQLYSDIYGRIMGTVGNEYLAYVYLDSSANSRENKLEKMILEVISKDKLTYFSWKARWEARPEHKMFSIWREKKEGLLKSGFKYNTENELNEKLYEIGAVFKVCTGNGQIPAFIVKDEKELKGIPKDLIIYVPIDTKYEFEINLIKNIKDIAGRPSSKQNKFIPDSSIILKMFDSKLKNVEGGVVVDSKDLPESLIWEKVKNKFFNASLNGGYRFYRASNAPRFIGLDPAYSAKGDTYGFSMIHLEKDFTTGVIYYIVDFSFPLLAGENGINLEAVQSFIVDLKIKGGILIGGVFVDSFNSAQIKQNLTRYDILVEGQSVDKTIDPYQYFLTLLYSGTVKVGKNVFLKNNLEGLGYKKDNKGKEKIDHNLGETNNTYLGDFYNSNCGINAKDVSDSLVSAVFGAMKKSDSSNIIVNYEEEEKRFNEDFDEEIKKKKIKGFFDYYSLLAKNSI